MKLLNCVLLFFLISITSSFGKDVYIDYNASKDCMDSYEYTKDGNEETPYLFFHLKISDNEKVILESGEDYTPRQYKPSNTLTCKDIERDEKFVDDVNSGLVDVFVVQEHTYGFRIYKIKKAEYYYNTSIAFGSRAEDYSYAYYYNQNSTGNLATKGSKSDVYFDEKDDENCLSHYNFRIKSSSRSKASVTILPEIGVLYKKADPTPPLRNGSELELKKINDFSIQDYLGLICKFYGGKPNTSTAGNSGPTGNTTGTGSTGAPYNGGNTTGSTSPGSKYYPPTNTPSTGTGTNYPNYPSSGGISVTGANSGNIANRPAPGMGRIYLDIDKGYYIDSTTGRRAEGTHGGNTYRNGIMLNNNTGSPNSFPTTSLPVGQPTNNTGLPTNTAPAADDSGCLEVSTADTHIVRKKETLFGIARTYGLSVQEIKKWNKIGSNNRIYPCMRLSITAPVTAPSKGISSDCDEQPTYNTHVVQKQETLFSIAKSYGVSVNQIKAWNGLRRNTIYPCTRLTIQAPADYEYQNRPSGVPANTSLQPVLAYIVQPQGTASAIGANAPTSYEYVGGKGGNTHTVKKKETLFSIAKVYGLAVNDLIRLNNLSSNMIKPGQVLLISAAAASAAPAASNIPQEYIYVNPALSSAASGQRQGVAAQPILSGQGGDLIEVNVSGTKRLVHVVQDDESLASIARYYNTTVAKLRALNDMDRNEVIVPFQRLYVE